MQSIVEHERIKLTSVFLSNLGSGSILTSIVAPYISFVTGAVQTSADWRNIVAGCMFGMTMGAILFVEARRSLEKLEATHE
jgi:formate/nitrite transporter FocA (FNT family)